MESSQLNNNKIVNTIITLLNQLECINNNFYQKINSIFENKNIIDKFTITKEIADIYINLRIKIRDFESKIYIKYADNKISDKKRDKYFTSLHKEISNFSDDICNTIKHINFKINNLDILYQKQFLSDCLKDLEIFKSFQNSIFDKKIFDMSNNYSNKNKTELKKIFEEYRERMSNGEDLIILIRNYITKSDNVSIENIYKLKKSINDYINY